MNARLVPSSKHNLLPEDSFIWDHLAEELEKNEEAAIDDGPYIYIILGQPWIEALNRVRTSMSVCLVQEEIPESDLAEEPESEDPFPEVYVMIPRMPGHKMEEITLRDPQLHVRWAAFTNHDYEHMYGPNAMGIENPFDSPINEIYEDLVRHVRMSIDNQGTGIIEIRAEVIRPHTVARLLDRRIGETVENVEVFIGGERLLIDVKEVLYERHVEVLVGKERPRYGVPEEENPAVLTLVKLRRSLAPPRTLFQI